MSCNTIVCIAPGPSLTGEQCNKVRGRAPAIVVNNAYQLAPWAQWLYACDQTWWDVYAQDVQRRFKGECWTYAKQAARQHGLNRIEIAPPPQRFVGLSTTPGVIHGGWNSGYQAINLALHFGAKRIVLIGYDLRGSHFFGEYRHPTLARNERRFDKWIEAFETIDPAKYGIEIINCTPASALRCFPTMDLDDGLQGLPAAA